MTGGDTMRRQLWTPTAVCFCVLGALVWSNSPVSTEGRPASPGQTAAAPASRSPAYGSVSRMTDTYCAGCHNDRSRSLSGTLLEAFDAARIAESQDRWSRAYRQLQAGVMPPVGARRPDQETVDAAL